MRNHTDLYSVLNVPSTATFDEIKKAYRKLAMKQHTDKGGTDDAMATLNNAYEVLSDAARKSAYDAMQASGADAIDRMFEAKGKWVKLGSTGERFSERYRKRFIELKASYQNAIPVAFDMKNVVPVHQSQLFDISTREGVIKEGGLLEFLKKHALSHKDAMLPSGVWRTPLTPQHAIGVLIDFVEGDYRGLQLKQLYDYMMAEAENVDQRERQLYLALANIFIFAYRESLPSELEKSTAPSMTMSGHKSLCAVTNYIKKTSSFSMSYCASLLQNEYFRDFYQWILVNAVWRQPDPKLIQNTLAEYNNYDHTREELQKLLDRQESLPEDAEMRSGFEQWVTTYKYLYLYEKNAKEHREKPVYLKSAEHHIECAYDIMDWFPVLGERVPREILANLLLQAGAQMQVSGQLSTNHPEKMACEKLSYEFYMNALMFANRSSLDVELYVLQHIISNISDYRFQNESAKKALPELVKLYSHISNVFPLYEEPQAHIQLFSTSDNGLQGTMRRLLYVLVDVVRFNRSHAADEAKPFDHKYVDVLYYAYEACLRRWYESNEATEKDIRTTLMEELLADRGWKFSDLNKRLQSPYIMIDRTPDGWLSPTRTLALPTKEKQTAFASLDAIEIDDNTGNFHFVMRDITGWQDPQQRVVSFSDIQEIFSHNVTGALLSLDEVNEYMRFHPFNKIRVSPTSLFETDFINTFLLTDYFLKFMTVGHEVNGQYPYNMRPVREMISHFPTHLKLIIEQFQDAQKDESAHRFWIEACPVNAFLPVQERGNDETTRIMVPEIHMIVKKHLLRRSASGALVDDQNEPDEGWHLYRFDKLPGQNKLCELATDKSVIVFTKKLTEVYFIPKGGQSEKMHLPNHIMHLFVKLSAMTIDDSGAISRTDENSSYLYYVVKVLCAEYKKPTLFSPEYVFAQEFTLHYDEFANCLPEFARLRELARLTVYVQLLNRVKSSNELQKTKLESILNDVEHWKKREAVVKKAIADIKQQYDNLYNQTFQDMQTNISEKFSHFNRDFSRTALERKYLAILNGIKQDIDPLDFNERSRQVVDAVDKMYNENRSRIINQHGMAQWNYNATNIRNQCDAEKGKIARELTRMKRESVHASLLSQYDSILALPRSTISTYVTEFMNGNHQNLLRSLVNESYNKSLTALVSSFGPFDIGHSTVENALTSPSARNSITKIIVDKNTAALRTQCDSEIARANNIISEEKAEIRAAIAKFQRVINKLGELGIGRKDALDQADISPEKCTWVPASVDRQENRTRLVYGGVHVQPSIHVVTSMNSQTQSAVNQCYSPSNHFRYSSQDLPRATQNGCSNNFQQRMASQPSAPPPPPSSGGGYGGGSSSGGGRRPPSPPPPGNGYSNSMSDALRHKVVLSFQEAGMMRQSEKLTQQAINGSERIIAGRDLNNPHLVNTLTAGGKNINDWGKYTTPSVTLSTGQSVQIHYYKHEPTGKISNIEYKVKGVVDYAGKPSAAERTGADPYRGTGKAKYASELFK